VTEREARRLLNEHRKVRPMFVRGRHRYTLLADGRVEVERAVGKSGLRWTYTGTVDRGCYSLPIDVRQRSEAA